MSNKMQPFLQHRWGTRLLVIAALFAALITISVSAASAAPADQSGSNPVAVTVQDTNSAPLSDRIVYVFDSTGANYLGLSATTGTAGEPATFSLAAGSYLFASDDVNNVRYSSALCNAPGCAATTISEPIFAAVTVAVQNASGVLGGRTVYVFDAAGTTYLGLSAVTNNSGVAAFSLPVSTYKFASDDANNVRYFSTSCAIASCATATINEPVFGAVNVTVQNTNGGLLSGRTVYVFDAAATTYKGLSAVTSNSGVAAFNLPIGTYTFAADDVNNLRRFSAVCDMTSPTLCGAATISEPVFAAVNVTVQNANGGLLSGRTVYVFNAAATTYQGLSAVTNGSGVATFNLPANTYKFASDDVNNVRYFSTACNTATCVAATIIEPAFGTVAVTVRDDANVPQANHLVYVFDGSAATYQYLSATTNGSGVATFNLPTGAYQFATDDVNNVRHFSGSACTVVGCTTATITLPVFGPVQVSVTDGVAPVASQQVYVFDGTGNTYLGLSDLTNAGGVVSFSLPVNIGYKFGANDGNNVRHISAGVCTPPACVAASITIPALSPVAVTVLSASGPVANAIVYAFNGAGTTYLNLSALTNGSGVATFNLPPGAYQFAADAVDTTRYFSGLPACTIPGCTAATIREIQGPGPVTIDLCATTGSMTLPDGASVAILGYALGDCTNNPAAQLPGPTLSLIQGDQVTLRLHNDLPATTSLLFQGQSMVPDLTGVAPGGTKSYSFTASKPGAFLYEAGLLTSVDTGYQVAMGLAGAMVVRPNGVVKQAYAPAATAFDDQAVLLLGEIDPALNNSGNPAAFDMRDYAPTYFLINGKASPQTTAIDTVAGHKVLLRYLNAGLQPHSMSLLGLHQSAIATDGSPYAHPHHVVAETIAPGQSADMLVAVPAAATVGSKYTVYDGSMTLHNASAGFGGMLTLINVGTVTPGNDTTGPSTLNVTLTPPTSDGASDVQIAALVTDLASGGANIDAAEFFIDIIGAGGNGTGMSGAAGATPTVAGTISAATLATLPSGHHIIYVQGRDSRGNWGYTNFAVLNLDKQGPGTHGIVLTPNPSNGSTDVAVTATGDDRVTGNNPVQAAEFAIDGGAPAPMSVNLNAPIVSLSATIPAARIITLSDGAHALTIRSQDALGNWGPWASAMLQLQVDKTAPTTSNVSVSKSPNNGALGVNSSQQAVRVDVVIADAGVNLATFGLIATPLDAQTPPVTQVPPVAPVEDNAANHLYMPFVADDSLAGDAGISSAAVKPDTSYVKRVEGFIDTVGATGTGFQFMATDSVYDQGAEHAYAFIPLSTITQLAVGSHRIYVHAQDGAGNWEPAVAFATLVIDKQAPVVSNAQALPDPTNTISSNNTSFALTATATDATSVANAEWFEGADPGAGNGRAMNISGTGTWTLSANVNFVALGWASGSHTISVRAKDAAGNDWSAPATVTVNVVLPNALFADGFEGGNFNAWSARAGNNRISVTSGNAQAGTRKMQAKIAGNNNITSGYVQDNTPVNEATYHARFYFNPNNMTINNNNAGTIFVGLNANNQNVFAVQVRRNNVGYAVRATIARAGGGGGGTTSTNWYPISTNGYSAIEIAWASGNAASFTLYTGGTLRQTLTNQNTNAFKLDTVRLGPQVPLNGLSGTPWFDSFVSTRRTVVGP